MKEREKICAVSKEAFLFQLRINIFVLNTLLIWVLYLGQESCTSGRTSPPYMMLAFAQQQQQRVLSFPELLDLSAAELEHLSQSEDRLDEFIDKLPPVVKLNNAVEDMISKNEELASGY